MNPQTQYYHYQNFIDKPETQRKLESLAQDIKKSWHMDCDETDSMKEIIEIIDGMLIMSSLEEYFSNNKSVLDYFMGDFSGDVIENILKQPTVFGDKGDEIAMELLFHFVKLFMKFHKNKEYSPLFEKIRKIFSKEKSSYFDIKTIRSWKIDVNPKKLNTFKQFNEEFCKNFEKEKEKLETFNIGDKVDISIRYDNSRQDVDKNNWVRGIIIDIKDNEYIIQYPNKYNNNNEIKFPLDSPNVLKEGTKTEDYDWRLSLKKNDVIDCYDRSTWYPATIVNVNEYENENGLIYKEYKVGFRLYPDHFLDNSEYDYNTFLQYYIFWDNNNNMADSEGNTFIGDGSGFDEDLPFFSKRIQKFQKYSSIQREIKTKEYNKLFNNIDLNLTLKDYMNSNINNANNNKSEGTEKLKLLTEILENDKNMESTEEFYFYEKDGNKNYIIGKDVKDFSYYYAILLKKMADEGHFEEMINILKDKPSVDEIYNIFFILMNSTSYIHSDFYKENCDIFKNAFYYIMENLSSKEIRFSQKEVIDFSTNFLVKVNYILSSNKNSSKNYLDEINLTLALKMIKSSVFDKKIQGLKSISEQIKNSSDENEQKNIIKIIKDNDIIKELFGNNYHTQIISKSNEILQLMAKNNEITEDEIKLIWSLTDQGDLETKMTIIKLLSDLIIFLNEKYCNILLENINKSIDKEKEKDKKINENEIELIYNLAIKGKNEQFLIKCCEYYCKSFLEINNLNSLIKSPSLNKILNIFSKGEKYCQIIISMCEDNLQLGKQVLSIFFLLQKIIDKYKKNIIISNETKYQINQNNDKEFINETIHKLIDEEKLLNLFKNSFLSYKNKAKESVKENKNEKNLIIDGFNHEDNMKNRIIFLIEVIPFLYPDFDFFGLLKEICINEPVLQTDKLFFYDFMKKFISENNSESHSNISKEKKISIEAQIFNMLTGENNKEMTLSEYNLYIEIFLDINNNKELLSFNKNSNDEYIINIRHEVNIEDIFGIEQLWSLLFDLNNELLTNKLINIIYKLYKNKESIQKLLDKCVNIIKDMENITYNKLEKCVDVLKFIILESEKNINIQIKSHFSFLKDCIINIPLESKKKKNNDLFCYFNNNNRDKNDNIKNLLFGNTTINELKQLLVEKYNLYEKSVKINLSYKENNSTKNKDLDSSYNNQTLKEILNIYSETNGNLNKSIGNKNILSSYKLVYTGEKIERESLTVGPYLNPKFENMIKEWFNYFSKGNDIMEKDNILNFISVMTSKKEVDENNLDYIQFMKKYDKDQKDFIMEDEFKEYYTDCAKNEPDKVWDNVKKMNYREDFQKNVEASSCSENKIEKNELPRYILGNDKQFHNALIKLFMKFDKKISIYQFLFFLCTNENEYKEMFDNFQKIFTEENNYLEQLYNLIIIESYIQDLEIFQLNVNEIFKEKKIKNKNVNENKKEKNKFEIISKNYLPFDDEKNLDKKKSFLVKFIENGGYESLIKYIENLLDCIDNNGEDEKIKIKCCQRSMKLINIIYSSFIEKNIFKENTNQNEVYYLNNSININKILNKEKQETKEEENNGEKDNEKENGNIMGKLKDNVLNIKYINLIQKLISFLLKFQDDKNQPLCNFCFDLLINLITSNELILTEIKNNDEIKNNFSLLIKNNINSSKNEKFFIQSLMKYINYLSKTKIILLDYEFLLFLFEISYSLFKESINKDNIKEKDENYSYSLFFDFFNSLFLLILTNDHFNEKKINLSDEFISHIYELLFNDLKEKDKDKKLSKDKFIGFMKLLITAITSDQSVKNTVISKKINDESLFEIIYSKVLSEDDYTKEMRQNFDDNQEIAKLFLSIEGENIDSKFIKMENLNDIILNINIKNKNRNEESTSQEVFDIYNDFIIKCLTGSADPEIISKLLKFITSKKKKSFYHQNNVKKQKCPRICNHVGLKNIGCICYVNSILQQMYMVPSFRYAIMSSDDQKPLNYQTSFFNNNRFDDNLLHQLQKTYTYLTYSEKQAYNPKDFCASFKDFDGAPINPMIQQDSQEFFNNLCDKIENSLKSTKYRYIIDNIFTGKTCSSVICEECNTISNRLENFYNLTLEVKNIKNLYESLQKLISPEKIDQFNCEVCKKKVTITKRNSLAKLPNVLFVHLKRFYMNYESEQTEKINSKFEFPNTLNLKNYCVEEISKNNAKGNETDVIYPKEEEYYEYELKGINVHIGNAMGGHYISFIDVERDGHDNELNIKSSIENGIIKSKWLKFNDSIITEFDPKDIPIESYGGSLEENVSNENIQNAYLLIYERKKKSPIKIIIDEDKLNSTEEETSPYNSIISFSKEKRASIDKSYDIFNSNNKMKEDELYKIIFKDEDENVCYSYIPYYNIEKTVLKDTFIEIMKKNQKFYKNKPIDNEKYKVECNDILQDNIHLNEFNILDDKLSLDDKKLLISFFKEQIFENNIFKIDSLEIEDEHKIIINDKANIYLEKLLLPILTAENKNDDLVEEIKNIILYRSNLDKIFEGKNNNKIFDEKNTKLFCEIIYSLIVYLDENKKDVKSYFSIIYDISGNLNEDNNNMIFNGYEDKDKDKNEKENTSNLYYIYELIYKLVQINNESIRRIYSNNVFDLLGQINKINDLNIRNVIYNILNYVLDHLYNCSRINKGKNELNTTQKEKMRNKLSKSKKLVKRLFKENPEILSKLFQALLYRAENFTNQFNKTIIPLLYEVAVENNKLVTILDILIDIINIKDEFTLKRLYIIMGYPEIILKEKIKNNEQDISDSDEEEKDTENNNIDKDMDDNDQKEDKKDKEEEKQKKDKKESKNEFFPLFGYRLFKESENGELYKYVNEIKLYETHCILALLFPCSNYELYANYDNIQDEPKLTEEERNKYIYKLLCSSLLDKGNYYLFKYIYLTQSRFILKYANLYEEMIEILSNENKYDLTEIKKNAEICIKRVSSEVGHMKENFYKITNKKFESDDEDNEQKENEDEAKNKEFNLPELPEKMEDIYKDNEEILQFMGFEPQYLPDEIAKMEYSVTSVKEFILRIQIKYYTTFKNIKKLRKQEKEKEKIKNEKNENKINDENEIKDESQIKEAKDENDEEKKEKEKEKEYLNEEEDIKNDNLGLKENEEENIYDVNLIKTNERTFIKKYFNDLKNENHLTLINKSFNIKEKASLSLVRYIVYSNFHYPIMIKAEITNNDKNSNELCSNLYLPTKANDCIKEYNYANILVIYRKNKNLKFINERTIELNYNMTKKDSFSSDNCWSQWNEI